MAETKRAVQERHLAALENLLEGEPPYPKGTVVRALQDTRDELEALLAASDRLSDDPL